MSSRHRIPPVFSIRSRLAWSATLLVLVVVAAIATVSYREVRASAVAVAKERLQGATRQLSDLLGPSARQVREQARTIAHDTAVQNFLRGTSDVLTPSISAALAHLPPQLLVGVELWDSRGNPRGRTMDGIAAPDSARIATTIALTHNRDSVAIGPVIDVDGTPSYVIVSTVAESTRILGYIVQHRRLTGSPQSAAQLRDLIAPGLTLLLGNANGGTWTDLQNVAPAPPIGPITKSMVTTYERVPGTRVLGSFVPIPATPWVIATEMPESSALAPAYTMLRRLGVVAFALLVVAAFGAWMMSRTLTDPIHKLVAAAEAMSAGDDAQRVQVTRHDELGVLGETFNSMAERIESGRATLENKVKELAQAEAHYHMLFDASPEASWVLDTTTGEFLAVNDAAVARYGYSREEFRTLRIHDVAIESSPAAVFGTPTRGDQPIDRLELARHRTKSGTVIDVDVSSQEISFSGRPARLTVVNDLTERRRAQQALRAAQERLERVIRSSGAILYELREENDGVALEWISANVSSILGYDADDVVAPAWWRDNVHPADRTRLAARPRTGAHRDGANEYRFRNRAGEYRWIREEQRVLAAGAGEPTRVVGAWLDITEQRELEEQFRQAQKMDAVGRLAGGVAHDFNNLLTIIIAESQFLLSGGRSEPEQREGINQIRAAADRAAGLTRQLLTFSRRQLGETTAFDMNGLVMDVEKMVRRLIGEDLEVRIKLSVEPLAVTADRGQIEQVLVNLAVNARDAMPEGGVLSIETSRATLDQHYAEMHPDVVAGNYVMLAVRDTGTGMSEEVKSHMFEPFFTTKEAGKGTGLGLATCYSIARRFGGHIAVYSESGSGTTMVFYLPESADTTAAAPARAPSAQRGTETILVVEDDAQVRRITVRALQGLGYTVLEASDASSASTILKRHAGPIHLLITDVVLPGASGHTVAETARQIRSEIRVLFLSGYSDDVVLRHYSPNDAVRLLQKPFTEEAMARNVRAALASLP